MPHFTRSSAEYMPDTKNILKDIELRGRLCYKSEGKITGDSHVPFCKKMLHHAHNTVLEMGTMTIVVKYDEHTDDDIESIVKTKFINLLAVVDTYIVLSGNITAIRQLIQNNPDNVAIRNIFVGVRYWYPELMTDIDIDTSGVLLRYSKIIPGSDLDTVRDEDIHKVLTYLRSDDIFPIVKQVAIKFITNRSVTHELVRHRPISVLQESQRYVGYDGSDADRCVKFILPNILRLTNTDVVDVLDKIEDLYVELLKVVPAQQARLILPNMTKTEIIVYTTLEEWNHILHMRCSRAADPYIREVMDIARKTLKVLYPKYIDETRRAG